MTAGNPTVEQAERVHELHEVFASMVARERRRPGPLMIGPALGTELLDTWQAWATSYDEACAAQVLLEAQLSADVAAVNAAIQQRKQALSGAVEAPAAIQRAWRNEREAVDHLSARSQSRAVRDWTPGELADGLNKAAARFESALATMRNNYSRVANKNAVLRGAAVRADLIPSYQVAKNFLAELQNQIEPAQRRLAEAKTRGEELLRALSQRAWASLEQLAEANGTSHDAEGPTAARFEAWEQTSGWQGSDAVESILWYYQSVPTALTQRAAATSPVVGMDRLDAPVVRDFRDVPGFVWFNARQSAVQVASDAARALVLRLMGAIPPGKARFTFIDPLGSGSNVAPFLELAEWDPLLVDSKAWCQQREISEKLSELNAHLELVIQKYLKGRFESIEDYNVAAGEVAEPYRFVVLFDFPAQFDEQSAHLLARLVQNGRRCGVYVLVVHNGDLALPHGLSVEGTLRGLHTMPARADLADPSGEVARPPIAPPNYGKFSMPAVVGTESRGWLRADIPPDLRFDRDALEPTLFTQVMLAVGGSGKGADDVIVEPERVNELVAAAISAAARSDLPQSSGVVDLRDAATWWNADSSMGVAVPIGRAGASDPAMFAADTQILSGALVVGRPGSGKSTLLHSLICGLATWYSPSEVELYLLDFKQGVEFLPYGSLGLPHARCVAVESEREFGVAILESVASEMNRRAEAFKELGPGVDNIGKWRAKTKQTMARIVVVIDEFQELLNRSDALSVRCSQLLDNLIRQGRAFGIHLVLGSQSLTGIDGGGTGIGSVLRLLPIRIVLPSDAADAAVALGERNDGAQYLTRRGEGIYNPAGGNPDHNVRFQGTLLSNDQRNALVAAARRRAEAEGFDRIPRVFDGRGSARIGDTPEGFRGRVTAGSVRALRVPVGVSVTLEPDLMIELSRDPAANLVFTTREEDVASGFGAAALAALALQAAQAGGSISFVDCTSAESGTESWLEPILASGVVQVRRARALPSLLEEVRAVAQARIAADEVGAAPHVLMIWGAHRARDLDPAGGGFGVVTSSDAPDPSADLEWVVRNGPEVGVHVVIYADSPTSLGRRLSATAIRDFTWRISGQLNDVDSDRFEVRASRLKANQLACANVETDRHWKVVGYSEPDLTWLGQVAKLV